MPPKGPPGVRSPTQRRSPPLGDKWKEQFPSLPPLQPGFPAARSGLAEGEAAAGCTAPRGGGPGAGEAGPGAVLTSSTVSGMQIRYSFSNMVLPAAGPQGGKRGTPPRTTKLPPRRRAGSPEPHSRSRRENKLRRLRSASGFLLPARDHVKVWVRAFAAPPPPSSPRSVLLERGVAKSGREGAPLETSVIRSRGR